MSTATAVAEDWAIDPLEPKGAAELYRRLEASEPRRVRRSELDGHVGLTRRELYELGCTLEPLNSISVGDMVWWRLCAVAGIVIASFGVAGVVFGSIDALVVTEEDLDTASGFGVAAFLLAAAAGGRALLRYCVGQLRKGAAERRQAGAHTAKRPSHDPHGRATVAAVRGPGVLRVQLLWLRGDAEDTTCVEVRTLAERQIEEDDAGRAEDAVAAMSEIALRADNAHGLRRHGGIRALGLRRRRQRPGDRLRAPVEPAARDDGGKLPREVDHTWAPEPLTEAGQAELARRLVGAEPERWSASVLERLLVDGAADAPRPAPPWPQMRKARPMQSGIERRARWVFWFAIVGFVVAMLSGGDREPTRDAVAAGIAALAVAVAAAIVPRVVVWRRPGRRLLAAVRAEAASQPRALEQGLAGAAGLFVVARGQGPIKLLHVRPAPEDGRRGELEVRALATRAIAEDDLDAITTFCAIAGEARLRSRGVGRSAHYLRSLVARLGHIPARLGEPGLWREPLAWVGGLAALLLVAASVWYTVSGAWGDDGPAARASVLLIAAYLAFSASRRIRDPFAD